MLKVLDGANVSSSPRKVFTFRPCNADLRGEYIAWPYRNFTGPSGQIDWWDKIKRLTIHSQVYTHLLFFLLV